ncbi:fumarate reductase/succinate dehydrogenase flavoprotein subunit [Actinomyces mediterranea]|uniref:fumarate reductase/succinate dehydrogenase flavoprotein subunit n=1 Tax=Actinomyces mediterranea TaxID=1871028 RepID=UPI00097084DB|nr:fumarate reductase/succinate dehydrogenase flavoprotein subunit [Actinomyces mediterranea]
MIGEAHPVGAGQSNGRICEGEALLAGQPEVGAPDMWNHYIANARLVSPANRRKLKVLIVGCGLAGAGAAVSLAELGYDVEVLSYHDTPRRAHSVAAQGGINAARAKGVDSDALARFVRDTVKGGDFRARESEAWRLGQESARVIDHMNALGVPFAREYGGALSTRSFGGVQVSRTYYSRGQTGQQLQVAASSALMRYVAQGRIRLTIRHDMLDLVVTDGRASAVIARNQVTGALSVHRAHAIVLATGGYGNIFFHSTLAKNSNASAIWRAHRRGAAFASPSLIQFHPTALPVSSSWQSKTTLMSESLRNDGRIWVPLTPGDPRPANDIPEEDRDYYLERRYPAFGNLTPRDIASRAAFDQITRGNGVGPGSNSVYLDFRDALARLGRPAIAERYGNLFEMYRDATGEDPYAEPMRIAPGAHFTMGGLWVDYGLQSTIPGLFVAGEANAAYHGANRLGANSLLAACVDGNFTIPVTVSDYLATRLGSALVDDSDATVQGGMTDVRERIDGLISGVGSLPARSVHRELGRIMYAGCGVVRNSDSLIRAMTDIATLRRTFHDEVGVTGGVGEFNPDLVEALRIADYLELAELMCNDALNRRESCGAHFRSEYATDEGEAQRRDDEWQCVSAWTTTGWDDETGPSFTHHREDLEYRSVDVATRSYR